MKHIWNGELWWWVVKGGSFDVMQSSLPSACCQTRQTHMHSSLEIGHRPCAMVLQYRYRYWSEIHIVEWLIHAIAIAWRSWRACGIRIGIRVFWRQRWHWHGSGTREVEVVLLPAAWIQTRLLGKWHFASVKRYRYLVPRLFSLFLHSILDWLSKSK